MDWIGVCLLRVWELLLCVSVTVSPARRPSAGAEGSRTCILYGVVT